MKLGHYNMPNSYIKFLIDSLTRLDVNAELVDMLTLVFFLLAFSASVMTNLRDFRKKRSF